MKNCIYLTNNSQEIRDKLANAGIRVCPCCSFKGYGWLNYYHRLETDEDEVHAVMGCDDDVPDEKRHQLFLHEANEYHQTLIECHNADEFINAINEERKFRK